MMESFDGKIEDWKPGDYPLELAGLAKLNTGQGPPERYPRFNELLKIMKTTHDKKGADYEGKGRPYENLRASEEWAIKPWIMAMMRVGEKLKRLQSYAQQGSLNNESAFDSLLDIAILSLIAYVLLEESKPHA